MNDPVSTAPASTPPASTADTGRPRPPLLRALGRDDPPATLELGGVLCRRIDIYKHDTFAATALYEAPDGRRIICKFNRAQPVPGIPARWLGKRLARRETAILQRLASVDAIPDAVSPVRLAGGPLEYATAHVYIPGHPLRSDEAVDDQFFPRLEQLVNELHAHDAAHVDLNKRENIIVDAQGRPHLIDFQLHFALPERGLGRRWPATLLLRVLQRSDHYHLLKHRIRLRPDQLPADQRSLDAIRPWWIRCWRCVATPWRQSRRKLLVLLRVRRGPGYAESEHEPEQAMRREE